LHVSTIDLRFQILNWQLIVLPCNNNKTVRSDPGNHLIKLRDSKSVANKAETTK